MNLYFNGRVLIKITLYARILVYLKPNGHGYWKTVYLLEQFTQLRLTTFNHIKPGHDSFMNRSLQIMNSGIRRSGVSGLPLYAHILERGITLFHPCTTTKSD